MLDEIGAHFDVALRKESVDRNNGKIVVKTGIFYVALRKESVDRNIKVRYLS